MTMECKLLCFQMPISAISVKSFKRMLTFDLKVPLLLMDSEKKYTILFIKALFQYKMRNYININNIFVTLFNSREFKGFSGSTLVYTRCLKLSCQLV